LATYIHQLFKVLIKKFYFDLLLIVGIYHDTISLRLKNVAELLLLSYDYLALYGKDT